jgi:hypothetical protein
MTQPFPLYDSLLEASLKASFQPNWKDISFIINSLTYEQCETIYALIYHHFLLSDNQKTFKLKKENALPYGGKSFEGGKGVLYTPSNFPLVLQQIINEYIRLI